MLDIDAGCIMRVPMLNEWQQFLSGRLLLLICVRH